ncbi:MAG: M14 family zinc carboxypeptidase [Saprospiraceae bacterium]
MRLQSLLFFCFIFIGIQAEAQRYSRVKIDLDAGHTIVDLARMGLDVEHGEYRRGKSFTGEFADYELAQIRTKGFPTQVLIDDLQAHLKAMNENPQAIERALPPCGNAGPIEYQTPVNYTYGSMGGYYTYQEMLNLLDTMAVKYPNIFKARQPVNSTMTTHEGRPIYWVKVSDNPDIEEAEEPQILYTALHHAREPNSMSQVIFYLWYLLENYETDPEVKYIVDNAELYFIPCVNPDGYIYNETTNPDGGGYWRKNRRDNGDGSFGVDLNRNYGFEWGYDNIGSSPATASQTYRGPSPSSEPETQMLEDFCLTHHFKVALNYHSYSNLLIWPWGYANQITDDHETFQQFGELLTQDNHYAMGLATQTVGYNVNGTSDDWMYGAAGMFAMTPEVGPGSWGFWPPQNAIDGLNKDVMRMNLTAAHLVLNYGEATVSGENFIKEPQGQILFTLKKIGLQQGDLTVALQPVSGNIAGVGSPQSFGLFHLEEVSGSLPFTLQPAIQSGDTVVFNLRVDNGEYAWTQEVVRIYAPTASPAVYDPGDDLSLWSAPTDWAITNEDYFSAPTSITDSPGANYLPNNFTDITLENPVDVTDAQAAELSFWAKWDIEEDRDYAQVMLSVNGGAYIPLCGKYSEAGTYHQDYEEPVYDGKQDIWVKEAIDLGEFLGTGGDPTFFTISFRLISDTNVESDGFYFDDLTLTVLSEDATAASAVHPGGFVVSSRPNPAGEAIVLERKGGPVVDETVEWQVFNALGVEVFREKSSSESLNLDVKNWSEGLYYYHVSDGRNNLQGGRFIIAR